jgi:NitT/TauT family transport system substrate-binding protein
MQKVKIFFSIFTAVFMAVIVFSYCHQACADDGLKKITFIPMWSPQAQFAGYYVAYEKGFYKERGLDVGILQGGPDYPPMELLKSGKADFCVMWLASAIQRRSEGLKLVNIAQMVQRSALMLVAKKSSGIFRPQDMDGKKVSLWEGDLQLQPKAFFKKYNLNVNAIQQSYTVNLFLSGGVDVASAMWYNEYHTILNSGINEDELSAFFFDRYGLNFPEDGIYVLEETFNKDPQAAREFVRASIEGWQYAFEHPDEAIEIILKYMKQAEVPANKAHQRWMLNRMKDIVIPQGAAAGMGILKREDYQRVAEELKNNGLIKEIPDYTEFFKTLD